MPVFPTTYYGAEVSCFSENPWIISNDGKLMVSLSDDVLMPAATVNIVVRYKKDNYFFDQKIAMRVRIANLKGDANGDGQVDIADITAIASYILGNNPEAFVNYAADANDDGTIDIADITTVASIILG